MLKISHKIHNIKINNLTEHPSIMKPNVYFFCLETKDFLALKIIHDECVQSGVSCYIIDNIRNTKQNRALFSKFCTDSYPVAVAASPATIDKISIFRPKWSFLSIGCEHGFAPFKKFTYSRSLCTYDHYFAPTKLWHDRLIKIYGSSRTKFHIGDFPRLRELKKKIEDIQKERPSHLSFPSAWQSLPSHARRQLVILTWGVNPDAMRALPDRPGIVYLLHPAQDRSLCAIPKQHASIIISSDDITPQLIAGAEVIFGDLSSLTLETAYIRQKVYMIFDRSLYTQKHDFDDEIFNKNSNEYLKIPATNKCIPTNCAINLKELINSLTSGTVKAGINPLSLEEYLFPPTNTKADSLSYCTRGIINIIGNVKKMLENHDLDDPRVYMIEFLQNAYRQILGREPDDSGMKTYINKLTQTSEKPMIAGLEIMLEMARSAEARVRARNRPIVWPHLQDF